MSRTFRREALLSRQSTLPPADAATLADDEHQLRGEAYEAVSMWPIAHSARLLGRLGLHKLAWDRIRTLSLQSNDGLTLEILLKQIAISHYLVESGTNNPFFKAIDQLEEYLDQRPHSLLSPAYLRPTALAAAKAAVHYGASGHTASCARWAARATELAYRFHNPEFEALLLHTRCDRARAFLPFLERRYDELAAAASALLNDAEQLISIAGDDDEALMARENKLAVCETASHMLEAVGDNKAARRVLETAAQQIDPYDPKIHLQLGDFHRRKGETTHALTHFITAGELDAPYSRIGWYSAGFLFEKKQRLHDAIGSYLLSLSYWPEGISAHAGIVRSAREIGIPEPDYSFARWAMKYTIAAPESATSRDARG